MRIPALLLAAFLAAAAGTAAVTLGGGPAAAATTVTIKWDGATFTSTPTVDSGTTVRWTNAATGAFDRAVTISFESGPTKFASFTVAKGATSPGVVMKGEAKAADEVVKGTESGVGGQTDNGTIHVRAAPRPSASPSPPPKTTSSPSPPAKKASPTPSPSAATGGQGATNTPALGTVVVPTPSPVAPPPPPAVAAPLIGTLDPTPQPTVTADPQAAALSQPVHARRLGLPGALAAVLLVGVAVGVVRIARAEYGAESGGPAPR